MLKQLATRSKSVGENRGEMGNILRDHRQDVSVAIGGIDNLARYHRP